MNQGVGGDFRPGASHPIATKQLIELDARVTRTECAAHQCAVFLTAQLPGTYSDIEGYEKQLRWSKGFEENLEYFRLDFLDHDDVARGEAFKAILPILWLMGGR
jgi:hypothetical protein